MSKAVLLEELTWVEAEQVLAPEAIVVIPLGAAAKEHGPHLKLKNDWTLAEYLKREVAARANVVIAPTVAHFFYPAFVEYPGSITLSLDTATALMVEICSSLARFGPRRFYVINTGISTLKALKPAAEALLRQGVLLSFTDLERTIAQTVREVSKQEGGSHADDIETSMMLYIAPKQVEMSKAVKDFDKSGSGRLSRTKVEGLIYSPSGVWGDATLATASKGERVVQSLIAGILHDIDDLSRTLPPTTVS